MPDNKKIDLTNEEMDELREVLSAAKLQYGVTKVMPQTEEVLEQFPGINPMGHYSEIDIGYEDRMVRCEYAARLRDPLAWEVYQDVKTKIQKTDAYKEMKGQMREISKKAGVIDHAIRNCDNERILE